MIDGAPTYYTYNEANQLETEKTAAGTTYYHHDGCGNTTAKQAAGGTTYLQYNTENLLTRIDFAAGGGHSYYTYDGDSKRVSQRTADGYTGFVYQGPDMLALQLERNEAGTTQAHYTIGQGLESVRRSGVSHFYHYNHLGTTIALTASNQAVSDTYNHDAWGVLLASTGSTVNPHTYVGRERYYRMADADLYHLGFRDYAQALGRFMTVDPVGSSYVAYPYTANRPTGRVDPNGLQCVSSAIGEFPIGVMELAHVRGPHYTRFRYVCTVFDVKPSIQQWCDNLAYLTSPSKSAMINDCIRCNAKRWGINCAPLDVARPDCMRKWCDGSGNVACVKDSSIICANETSSASTTDKLNPECRIRFCLPRAMRYHDKSDRTIPGAAATFLHELAHCCGVQHGRGKQNGQEVYPNCNDAWACCIWNVVVRGRWQKSNASDKQGCRYDGGSGSTYGGL